MSELGNYIINKEIQIIEAMKIIDRNTAGLVYVVDQNRKLIGCLTDGDVRRWIIKNGNAQGTVYEAMNHNPKYILIDKRESALELMKKEKIFSVAVITATHQIVDVIFEQSFLDTMTVAATEKISGVPVVIMAGGKGTRLYPYTKVLPKPLIPIGETPIIERILNRFYRQGIKEFWLSVNYKKEMIKSYFAELNPDYFIHYIEEEKPLGTAGSIRLIEKTFDKSVIITNCDCLIDVDYSDIIKFHMEQNNDLTIVSSLKNILIPYGVLRSEKRDLITAMEEKPKMSFFINTGMYILAPQFISWIPENEAFHMTQLADIMIKKGKRVGMYPISEDSFLDMGEFEEMSRMEERIKLYPQKG